MLPVQGDWLDRHTLCVRFAAARWRHALRIGLVVSGVALAIFLLWTGDLLVPGPKWDPTPSKPLATLNQMLAGVMASVCLLIGLAFLWKGDRPHTMLEPPSYGAFDILTIPRVSHKRKMT